MFEGHIQRRVPKLDWTLCRQLRQSNQLRVRRTHRRSFPSESYRQYSLKPPGLQDPLRHSRPTALPQRYLSERKTHSY